VKYAWSFGDGTNGFGEVVSHTYTASGSFTPELVVTDNRGKEGTVREALTVQSVYTPPPETPDLPTPSPPPSPTGVTHYAGYDSPESLLPIPEGAGNICFMEYAGSQKFRVVVLDFWGQRVAQLVDTDGAYEGLPLDFVRRREHPR